MRTKTIFLLMAAALVMGFAACSKDDGNENSGKVIDLSTVKYELILQNGDVVTGKLMENLQVLVADGAKITLRDAVIKSEKINENDGWAGINCLGNATITIEGNDTVCGNIPGYPGILPGPTGTTLTIRGTGSLYVSGNNSAGIGGTNMGIGGTNSKRKDGDCGNIVIEGGTINATGGNYGAGIGYGQALMSMYTSYGCGNITIKGGTVTAKGGQMAAGIGSAGNSCCTCRNISITGGTVMAIGGKFAPGIGSGCGNITISGGTVRAIGNEEAPGVGSACFKDCGDITISGGTVFAIAGKIIAPAIGTVRGGKCGNIMITGGIVNAVCHCHSTAAIGSGGKDSKFESITITSGITSLTAIEEIVTTLPIDQVRTTPLIGKGPEDAGSGDVNIDGKLNPDVSWMGDGMKTLKPWIVEWGELNWTIKR